MRYTDLARPAKENASPALPSRASSSDATRAQLDEAAPALPPWHRHHLLQQRRGNGHHGEGQTLSPDRPQPTTWWPPRAPLCSQQPARSTTSLPPPLLCAPPTPPAFLLLASLSLALSHHSWLKLRWNFVFLSSEFGPGKSLPAIPVASQ